MKKILLILCLIFMTSLSFAQTRIWPEGTLAQAKDAALKEAKNVLILFSCGDG